MLYQQGDVLLESIASIPPDARLLPRRARIVLAEGETTGHAHAVEHADVELYEYNGRLYCRALESFVLVHEEHMPVKLAPGTYEVRRVREFDHFSQQAREVMD
jgi:hypothetical protein